MKCVYEWFLRLQEGQESVSDNARSERPSTSVGDENIEKLLPISNLVWPCVVIYKNKVWYNSTDRTNAQGEGSPHRNSCNRLQNLCIKRGAYSPLSIMHSQTTTPGPPQRSFRDVTGMKPCPNHSPNQLLMKIACGAETTLMRKKDTALLWYPTTFGASPDNAHSVVCSQHTSSLRLIEDETFNDSDIINNLINYKDGQEAGFFENR
ncbi:hypothetical protein TNCV_1576351 [Trichonephila clavipes]|nr:hypothetical protein TNCV_1576351 [Trichonephila clavipes]